MRSLPMSESRQRGREAGEAPRNTAVAEVSDTEPLHGVPIHRVVACGWATAAAAAAIMRRPGESTAQ